MDDLIGRQAVIDVFYQYPNVKWTTLDVMEKINEVPSAQPEHGRWIYYGDETIEDGGRCSVCGGDQPAQWVNKKWQYLETKYCPNCGAYMMDGEKNEQ